LKNKKDWKIALLGNPNSGKTSLFNALTGLRQKTGNYPGVTVEKLTGTAYLEENKPVTLLDLPGTYSLYPNSRDEKVVVQVLCDEDHEDFPDAILYVADITNLERQLLLLTQIKDLGFPVILALSMSDVAEKEGLEIETERLRLALGIEVIKVSGRTMANLDELKKKLLELVRKKDTSQEALKLFYAPTPAEQKVIQGVQEITGIQNSYRALLYAHHYEWLHLPEKELASQIARLTEDSDFESLPGQIKETMIRYDRFLPVIKKAIQRKQDATTLTDKIDNIATHRWLGPLFFFGIMFFVFQAIYAWAAIPMDWIDGLFSSLKSFLSNTLPESMLSNLLTDGIIAGLGGILIFIPQIAILFFLIGMLEDIGYMSRAVFIFDKLMQRFGLNGRSIVSLISGGACAIPAVMATRTISNWKERLITILVTPLISCSARIPVFVMIIGLVIPARKIAGILNLQGIAFMSLYLLGIVAALGSAYVFKLILKSDEYSYLVMELPPYRRPNLTNIGLNVADKVKAFVIEAGKIIMIISIVLWVIASFGPPGKMQEAENQAKIELADKTIPEAQKEDILASKRLEASYAGHLGRFIEPAIEPLGFDWKIGIALVTSFAAREVFVGTIATLYSLGSEADELKLQERLSKEVNPNTGAPVFSFATGISLLLFYLLAMQCMSTLAVVKRETGGWKWPVIQFFFMSILAYLSSLAAYQFLH
jgi:ferrous iron transport protein B